MTSPLLWDKRGTPEEKALKTEFGAGFAAGIEETLNQLEGRSTLSPNGHYTGPIPPELARWMAVARARLSEWKTR